MGGGVSATKVHQPRSALYGEFKSGVSVINKKVKIGDLDTCINTYVISNILSTTKPYKSVCCITYDTRVDWVLCTPEGNIIKLNCDSG